MHRHRHRAIGIAVSLCLLVAGAKAQLIEKKTVSLDLAKQVAAAAEREAGAHTWNVVIAVVDDGGNLVYLGRMDNAQTGSIEVAIQKARTAISFRRPTKAFEEMVGGGRNAILSLPGAVALEGGVPLIVGGRYIGAIGVSGATSAEDGVVARAGAEVVKGL